MRHRHRIHAIPYRFPQRLCRKFRLRYQLTCPLETRWMPVHRTRRTFSVAIELHALAAMHARHTHQRGDVKVQEAIDCPRPHEVTVHGQSQPHVLTIPHAREHHLHTPVLGEVARQRSARIFEHKPRPTTSVLNQRNVITPISCGQDPPSRDLDLHSLTTT